MTVVFRSVHPSRVDRAIAKFVEMLKERYYAKFSVKKTETTNPNKVLHSSYARAVWMGMYIYVIKFAFFRENNITHELAKIYDERGVWRDFDEAEKKYRSTFKNRKIVDVVAEVENDSHGDYPLYNEMPDAFRVGSLYVFNDDKNRYNYTLYDVADHVQAYIRAH
jgi:hypothetical protein